MSTLYLFSQNRNGAATGVCGGVQLISCQIYDNTDDNDVPLRDFVPCYVAGDKTQFGLYDLVEGAFHPMGNTSYAHNSFELGPDAGDIDATARDESAVADGTPYNIAVSVTDPAEGAGCSYEWSTDGVTYSSVFDGVTTPGTHTVYCRISATDYQTKVVSGKVYLYDGAPSWIDSRTSYTIGSLAFGNWNGHYPQIEDLYLRGYATSISKDSIGRDARTVRVWLARETPEWKAWIAEKVTPWADLSADVQAEYVTRFGAGAQKPVGVTVSGVFNKPQWILRYSATPGVILYVR